MPEHSRLDPLNLTHGALAEAMGVPRTLVNEPCNRRGGGGHGGDGSGPRSGVWDQCGVLVERAAARECLESIARAQFAGASVGAGGVLTGRPAW